jgi:hypothetical protein
MIELMIMGGLCAFSLALVGGYAVHMSLRYLGLK